MAVRSSKYRHVYGATTRKDKCFDNIRLTKNAFDANLAKSNGKYISLNWEASGGGSFAVIPVAEQGKLPDRFPLFDGHRGAVLDTDWNPFDEEMVVSASEDGTIGVWEVPKDFSVHEEYASLDECENVKPKKFLHGHGKKVGHVLFNPVAANVLASTSLDNTVKIWDLESGDVLFTLQHPAFVTSLSWNYDGTKLTTVAKDRILRIWDVRAEKVTSEGKGHAGAKGSRVVWLGDSNRVLTTGFSLVSDREMALWDVDGIDKGPIGGFRGLDPSSGIVIPHYDPMTSMVYLGGRGDGKIVYYEFADDNLYDLFAYNSTSPQRGLGWIPNRCLDPSQHEVARVYKVHESFIEPIPFLVPLKTEGFLDDVYKMVEAGIPALTATQWKQGETKRPLVKDWKQSFEGKEPEAKESPKESPKESSKATPRESSKETPKDSSQESPKEPTPTKNTPASADSAASSTESGLKSSSDQAPKSAGQTAKEQSNADNAKAQDQRDTEPKKAAKEDKVSAEEVAALEKAEKQDSNDVLQSDDVKNFLAKNTDEQEESSQSDAEADAAWGSESAAPSPSPSLKPQDSKINGSQEKAKEEAPKPDEPRSSRAEDNKPKSSYTKTIEEKKTEQTQDGEISKTVTKVSNVRDAELAREDLRPGDESKFEAIMGKLDELTNRIAALEATVTK